METSGYPVQGSRLEKFLQESVLWIQTHRDQFLACVAAVVLVIGGSLFYFQRQQSLSEQSWFELAGAHSLLLQGKSEDALISLDKWFVKYPRSDAASHAYFLKGEALQKANKLPEAIALYKQLSQTAEPKTLRPLALAAQSSIEELAGAVKEARATAEQFIKTYPDHYMTGTMYLLQARMADTSGDKAAAASIYERFQVLYPQSPFIDFAKQRQQFLAPTAQP